MSHRLYPHRRIKYWLTYDIDDICATYHDRGSHPQTVRAWIKSGLKAIDNKKPTLVYGQDLINYLQMQNDKHKCPTAFDEMYCLKCKDARNALHGRVRVEQRGHAIMLSALCRTCRTLMFKGCKWEDLSAVQRTFNVADVLELFDDAGATSRLTFLFK
jgi:hypothetical protein